MVCRGQPSSGLHGTALPPCLFQIGWLFAICMPLVTYAKMEFNPKASQRFRPANLILTFRAQEPSPESNCAANRVPHTLGACLPDEASCPPQSRTVPAGNVPKRKKPQASCLCPSEHGRQSSLALTETRSWGEVRNSEEQHPLLEEVLPSQWLLAGASAQPKSAAPGTCPREGLERGK